MKAGAMTPWRVARVLLASIAVVVLSAQAGGSQFATYTGTPTVPEAAGGFAGPSGFQVSICPVSRCPSRAWQGYRPLGEIDPTSAATFVKLARDFGAGYLKARPEQAASTILVRFAHSSRELGTRSLFTGRGTLSTRSEVVLKVVAGGQQVVVMTGYRAINSSGKVYAVTGASPAEAQRNYMMFSGSARL
jgi:hypothetical protein